MCVLTNIVCVINRFSISFTMRNAAKTWCIVLSLSTWLSLSKSMSMSEDDCLARCDCHVDKRVKVLDCIKFGLPVYKYIKDGITEIVSIECNGKHLNESMLQCLDVSRNIAYLQLERCPISLEAVLAAININATNLKGLCLLEHQANLTKELLREFNNLSYFTIKDSGGQKVVPVESLKVLPKLSILWLYNAGLTDIPAKTFFNKDRPVYQELQSLVVELNNFTSLGDDAFEGLDKLKTLSIQGNNIKKIDVNAFRGLDSLTSLEIINEAISLPPGIFEHTRQLSKLLIDRSLKELRLEKGVISSHAALTTLTISHSKKLVLGSLALSYLPLLKSVEITESNITELPEDVFLNSTNITSLDLRNNLLRNLSNNVFSDLSQLETLNVSNNTLESINRETFAHLERLKHIDMSGNQIKILSNGMFLSSPLETVSFAGNGMYEIHEYTFRSSSLTHLNLSLNQLSWGCRANLHDPSVHHLVESSLKNLQELVTLDLSHNKMRGVCVDWLHNMKKLAILNLSNNLLKSLWEEELEFLGMVPINVDFQNNSISRITPQAYASDNSKFKFGFNPFNCDCHLYKLLISNNKTYDLNDTRCSQPETLKNVTLLKLSKDGLDSLTCSVNKSKSCDQCLFRPNKNRIDCSCRNTIEIPDIPDIKSYANVTMNLKLLALRPNVNLRELPSHVTALDLSSLKLNYIPDTANISELDLRNNSLTKIPLEILNKNMALYLEDNPLQCNCWGTEDIMNLQNKKYCQFIKDYDDMRCKGGFYVKNIAPETLCDVYYSTVIALSCLAVGAILLITVIFAYIYIPEVQVLLMAGGLSILVNPSWISKNYTYDIYLSYATKNAQGDTNDEHFVTEKLVPELRRMEYKVHGFFDFAIGATILDEIYDSVKHSKITLFTISNAFIHNCWSLEELRSTLLQGIIDRSNRIMFIILEDLNLTEHEGHAKFKALLKGYTCIKKDSTDEQLFKKLKKRLHKRLTPKEITRRRQALQNVQAFGLGNNIVLTENGELLNQKISNTNPAINELQVLVPTNGDKEIAYL